MDAKYEDLQSQVERLKRDNRKLREFISAPEPLPTPIPEPLKTSYQVFHRPDTTNLSTYEPTWRLGENGARNLHFDMLLKNAAQFLEKHPEIAFVVYKDYRAVSSSDSWRPQYKETDDEIDTVRPPSPYKESIKLISGEMVETFGSFMKKLPDFEYTFPSFNRRNEIAAPYLFWYHYRSVGDETIASLSPRHGELMTLLTKWIEEQYGAEYERAKALLDKGFISQNLMKYFVQPGDVLVSWKDGMPIGTMCTTWAKWESQSPLKEESRGGPGRTGAGWGIHNKSGYNDNEDMSRVTGRRFGFPEDNRKLHMAISKDKSGGEQRHNDGYSLDDEPRKEFVDRYQDEGWRWKYDGSFIQKKVVVSIRLQYSHLDQEVKITSLNAYHIAYANKTAVNTLKIRGETFCSFRDAPLVEYREESWGSVSMEIERYIIDYVTYRKLHPDKYGPLEEPVIDSNPSSEPGQIYLFPQQVNGYNLLRKRRVDLQVDRIRPVNWNKKAFDNLVLDSDTKELVHALVMTHIEAEKGTDIIGGKGNGLIMLLHGGPGTGKTFTAETVAEITEKPLYCVTCGDIGMQPEKVEKYFESVLNLGKIWGCVVLLDEADVFLEERSLSQLDRNALVSVFLRVLVYYEGILILTSNRVGTFDEAFKSRIQLALHYPNLEMPQRRRIWGNFLNRLKEMDQKALKYDSLSDHIDDLAEHSMSERQIRNVITTARQLARYRGEILDFKLLDHVIAISTKFDVYLKEVKKGLSDDEIARGMLNR